MHIDHRIRLVSRDQGMGWLVNHSNLCEVGSASENLTGTVQICSVADPYHRQLARRYEVTALECSGRLHSIDYFRPGHFQYSACDIRLHTTLPLGHSANYQAAV